MRLLCAVCVIGFCMQNLQIFIINNKHSGRQKKKANVAIDIQFLGFEMNLHNKDTIE